MKLRQLERQSIRDFLESHSEKLTGRVLDNGCGEQPYRDIVERAGGEYHGVDSPDWFGSVVSEPVGYIAGHYDAVISTQVLQFVVSPIHHIKEMRGMLRRGGHLLMTGPTNWAHIEPDDKWRFTTSGVVDLLHNAGFRSSFVWPRASVRVQNENWSIGWASVSQL